MHVLRRARRPIAVIATAALIAVMVPLPAAQAALVGTEAVITETENADARARITEFLDRAEVTAQMEALGVSPAEAKARVATLTDEEVARINGRLETMPAGKGIIAAVLIVFLVLVLTDILGYTHVFGFTNKGSAK